MDIKELAEFLKGKLESDSKVASVGTDRRPHLEIDTQQELGQDFLVGLVREFCSQKGYKVTNNIVGLNIGNGSIVITASEISPQSNSPPFHSFITVN